MRVRPDGFVAGEHLHPRQEERFWVADGEITLRLHGEERRYVAGEAITIPASSKRSRTRFASARTCLNRGENVVATAMVL